MCISHFEQGIAELNYDTGSCKKQTGWYQDTHKCTGKIPSTKIEARAHLNEL